MTVPTVSWVYPASPLRVVDGDTVILLIDNGFRNREEHSIRLLGVDAPELFSGPTETRAEGAAWKAKVEAWMAEATADGTRWPLIVRTDRDRQTFNRYLGAVWRLSDGQCLNDWLQPDPEDRIP